MKMSLLKSLSRGPLQIAVIGGGNWGTTVGRLVATKAAESYLFHNEVWMWMYEEQFEGRNLTELINEIHENKKYLPGFMLPHNLHVSSSIEETVKNASLLIFVVPHQFLTSTCELLKPFIHREVRAISLIKGIHMRDRTVPVLCSSIIKDALGCECCALSGANVARDVAKEQFCETTIGYTNMMDAMMWQALFETPNFRVNCIPDLAGVETCGALKNIIALAAGFIDGLGLGTNTKAAIIRLGMLEIKQFACLFFSGVVEDTFYESAGIADVITTCFGGRNVKCAKEFIIRGNSANWDEIERDLLAGQKIQGTLACEEVYNILSSNDMNHHFPLMTTTYEIAFRRRNPNTLLDRFKVDVRNIRQAADCVKCDINRINKDVSSPSGSSTR